MTCTLIVIDTFTMLWNGACRILTPAGSASHVIPKIGPHKFIALRAGGDIAVAIGPLWDDNYYHADIRRAVACTDPKWRVSKWYQTCSVENI